MQHETLLRLYDCLLANAIVECEGLVVFFGRICDSFRGSLWPLDFIWIQWIFSCVYDE